MISERRLPWLKLAALLLAVCALALMAYHLGAVHFFMSKERITAFLDSLGPAAFVGFILLQAVQVVAAPIPGEVTGLLGGYLYGPVIGTLLSTAGLTLGSYIAFALSRALGRPFVERFVSSSTMGRFDYLLHRRGAFIVFMLFLIPGIPKDILCYILGLGHLSTMQFIAISATGRLFGTILLTVGGSEIRHRQYGSFFILAALALVAILMAMAYRDKLERLFRRWNISEYRKKRKRARSKGAGR